ncbi:hypothetical protein AZZ73_000127, partial [Klebsiella pneumoniae]
RPGWPPRKKRNRPSSSRLRPLTPISSR